MAYVSDNGNRCPVRPAFLRETEVLLVGLAFGTLLLLLYIATTRWHFSIRQIQEIATYSLLTLGFAYLLVWRLWTQRRRTAKQWPPLGISVKRDRRNVADAWAEDAVVLGYDAL